MRLPTDYTPNLNLNLPPSSPTFKSCATRWKRSETFEKFRISKISNDALCVNPLDSDLNEKLTRLRTDFNPNPNRSPNLPPRSAMFKSRTSRCKRSETFGKFRISKTSNDGIHINPLDCCQICKLTRLRADSTPNQNPNRPPLSAIFKFRDTR